MSRRSLVDRMYDLEKLKAHNAAAVTTALVEPIRKPIQLVHEDCRKCGTDSKLMHPAGVIAGLWRCYRCLTWQDDVVEVAAGG